MRSISPKYEKLTLFFAVWMLSTGCQVDLSGLPCASQADCEVEVLLCPGCAHPALVCAPETATKPSVCLKQGDPELLARQGPDLSLRPDGCALKLDGFARCQGRCVDTRSDPRHCGACDTQAFLCEDGELTTVTNVAVGWDNTCVTTDSTNPYHSVYCWGSNDFGKVDPELPDSSVWQPSRYRFLDRPSVDTLDRLVLGANTSCMIEDTNALC